MNNNIDTRIKWCEEVYKFIGSVGYTYDFNAEGLATVVSVINKISTELKIPKTLIRDKFEQQLFDTELAKKYNIGIDKINDIMYKFVTLCSTRLEYRMTLINGVFELTNIDKNLKDVLYKQLSKENWDSNNYYLFLCYISEYIIPYVFNKADKRIINLAAFAFKDYTKYRHIIQVMNKIIRLYNYGELCYDIKNNTLNNMVTMPPLSIIDNSEGNYNMSKGEIIEVIRKCLDDFDPHRKLLLVGR